MKYQNYYWLKYIKPPKLEFNMIFYNSSGQNSQLWSQVDIYRNYVAEVAKFLGASEHQAEELKESVDFEMELIFSSININQP
ncbi:Protein of unknown function [Cotesia congregata]|uniref:Uncharacterized protein n=1 Tax=Cotesia congregata TaxID=51543 RepID=A0A8J2MAY9_COTCN|nr:Protein of unknown function [Cotesia congregata]